MSDSQVIIDLKVTGDAQAAQALEATGRRGAAGLRLIEGGARRSASALDDFARRATSGAMPRFGMLAQQTGFQVGDMATQIAGGTSAMRAFGQQAPQLLGFFGPFGAIAGASVAVLAAFAGTLTTTGEAAETSADLLSRLADATGAARQAAITNIEALAAETKAYGELNPQLIDTLRLKSQLLLLDARTAASAAMQAPGAVVGEQFNSWTRSAINLGSGFDLRLHQDMQATYGLSAPVANALQSRLMALSRAGSLGEQGAALEALRAEVQQAGNIDNDAFRRFTATVVDATLKLREFTQAERDAAAAAELLARPVSSLQAEIDRLNNPPARRGGGGGGGAAQPESLDFLPPTPTPRPLNAAQVRELEIAIADYERLTGAVDAFGQAGVGAFQAIITQARTLNDALGILLSSFAKVGAEVAANALLSPLMSGGTNFLATALFGAAPNPTVPLSTQATGGGLFGGGLMGPGFLPLRPGGAFGGDFIVPGYGGHDSVNAIMRVSPGERISVGRGGQAGVQVVLNVSGAGNLGRDPTRTLRPAMAALETSAARFVARAGRNG